MTTVYLRNQKVLAGLFIKNGVQYAKLSGNPFGKQGGPRCYEVIETRGRLVVNLRKPLRK